MCKVLRFQLLLLLFTPLILKSQQEDCLNARLLTSQEFVRVDKIVKSDSLKYKINNCVNSNYFEYDDWYKFEIHKSGYLAFTITPIESFNDLDFFIFKVQNFDCNTINWDLPTVNLTNHLEAYCISDCKVNNQEIKFASTGMSISENDLNECSGCLGSDNGFIKHLKVRKGEKYFLVINNFSGPGGYTLNFCGNTSFFPLDTVQNESCQDVIFKFSSFLDEDKNGVKNSNELNYIKSSLTLVNEIDTIKIFGSSENEFTRIVLPHNNYKAIIEKEFLNYWDLTTKNDSINIPLEETSGLYEFNYGFYPKFDTLKFKTHIQYNSSRCNEETQLCIYLKSITADSLDRAILWLDNVNELDVIKYYFQPDTINGSRIGYYINNIYPGLDITRCLTLVNPPIEDFIETFIEFKASIEVLDTNYSDTTNYDYHYKERLRCSYDPNDKLVMPIRQNNTIYNGEFLTYTIRFQNTGNDVAYDVRIEDELSDLINVSSFELLKSSHDQFLTTTIKDRKVEFSFEGINLPDSTSNFLKSQGFVTFKIKLKPNLKHGTEIKNNAAIYFDLNEPIITNETINTIEIPGFIDPNTNKLQVNIIQNPIENILKFSVSNSDQSHQFDYYVYDNIGRLVLKGITSSYEEINISAFQSGLYYLKLCSIKGGSKTMKIATQKFIKI